MRCKECGVLLNSPENIKAGVDEILNQIETSNGANNDVSGEPMFILLAYENGVYMVCTDEYKKQLNRDVTSKLIFEVSEIVKNDYMDVE